LHCDLIKMKGGNCLNSCFLKWSKQLQYLFYVDLVVHYGKTFSRLYYRGLDGSRLWKWLLAFFAWSILGPLMNNQLPEFIKGICYFRFLFFEGILNRRSSSQNLNSSKHRQAFRHFLIIISSNGLMVFELQVNFQYFYYIKLNRNCCLMFLYYVGSIVCYFILNQLGTYDLQTIMI